MKAKTFITALIYLYLFSPVFPQEVKPQSLASDYDCENISASKYYSTSRFMRIYTENGIDRLSSPAASIFIDDVAFNLLPLNFRTADLAPVNKIDYFLRKGYDGNGLYLNKRETPDSLLIDVSAYIGSETGDPLIYLYTKPDDPRINNNINKFVPSGALSISNKISDFRYKLSLGYYGYYITGAKNDAMLQRLHQYYFFKQNKQIYAGIDLADELSKSRRVELSSHFISYYGWDIPPFIGAPVHFENYSLSSGLTYTHSESFSLVLRNDVAFNDINDAAFFSGAQTLLSETSLNPVYKMQVGGKGVNLSGGLNYITAQNRPNTGSQEYLSEEINKLYGSAALKGWMELPHNLKAEASGKYGRHYNDEDYFSYSGAFTYNNAIGVRYSSEVKVPNFNELYGKFEYAYSDTSYLFPEYYNISGNKNLKEERDNTISVFYNKSALNKKIDYSAVIYYKIIENQIGKAPAGENTYTYVNYSEAKAFGADLQAETLFSDWGKLSAVYNYIDNRDFIHASKHTLTSQFCYYTSFNSEVSFIIQHKGKQDWRKQYASLLPAKDILTETTIYNIYYEQSLENFYLISDLKLKIEVQNIFDRKYRNSPIGNNLRRAVLFYLNASI